MDFLCYLVGLKLVVKKDMYEMLLNLCNCIRLRVVVAVKLEKCNILMAGFCMQ